MNNRTLSPAIRAHRRAVKAFAKAHPFRHVNLTLSEPPYGVQAGVVYVYDETAGHFTACHSLPDSKRAEVLAALR